MITVDIYNQEGGKAGTKELNPKIFEVTVKPELIQQVIVARNANMRRVLAHTKTRAEVSGGGKKPWKQKGTGRARHGSIRSPIWRGGGVTFGPLKNRNFSKKINTKMKRQALLGSLSDKAQDKKIILVDKLDIAEPKTQTLVEVLNRLPLEGRKVLLTLPGKNGNVMKAVKNIQKVHAIEARNVNVYDVTNAGVLLMPVDALAILEETFLR